MTVMCNSENWRQYKQTLHVAQRSRGHTLQSVVQSDAVMGGGNCIGEGYECKGLGQTVQPLASRSYSFLNLRLQVVYTDDGRTSGSS